MSSGIQYGGNIISEGLVFYVDAFKDINGYNYWNASTSQSIWYDLSNYGGDINLTKPTYNDDGNGSFNIFFESNGIGSGTTPDIGLSGSVTIECFIKPTVAVASGVFNFIFAYGGSGATETFSYGLGLSMQVASCAPMVASSGGTDSGLAIISSITMPYGAWYGMTLTMGNSSALNKFYLNGGAQTSSHNRYSNTRTNTSILIGRPPQTSASSRYLRNARIGSIKVWNRILSEKEILESYNTTKDRYGL